MLYRGSEVMREVKWVIFDEVHYMRDRERGVVWEESIILLPHKVRFVFLSATIPNSKEFAEWVAKIHHQTCHVIYTDYRPTPLQHFIHPAGSEGIYLVVDEKGRFREDNFAKAMATLGTSNLEDAVRDVMRGGGKKNKMRKMGREKGGPTDLERIVRMIMTKGFDPVIVFSFSKRECEKYAMELAALDFTSDDEKTLIEQVFMNAIDSLSEDDKSLPQIDTVLPLLKRGIGVHHGGLLPILKEVIEILFQESLLKILFATETFSMGINMPARTVVFTASRKFDGTDFRWISPGEYIQMSGRAGRRGLDDRGIVIQMMDEKMEPSAAKEILKGTADALNSAFHLGYNMLLNLLRIEDGDPERLMALSFHQFQAERAAPAMEEEVEAMEKYRQELLADIPDQVALGDYHSLCVAMDAVRSTIRDIITIPKNILPFLQVGRLLKIQDGETHWGWGILVSYSRNKVTPRTLGGKDKADSGQAMDETVLEMLLPCALESADANAVSKTERALPTPASPAEIASGKFELKVIPVLLPLVAALSSIRLLIPKNLQPKSELARVGDRYKEVMKRFPKGVPIMDPIEDMNIDHADLPPLIEKARVLEERISANSIHTAPNRDSLFAKYAETLEIVEKIKFLKAKIKSCHTLAMKTTLNKMKRVLRRLGHISAENVVLMKGRVAAEVNSADELLVTELIFTGVFNDLDAAQCAALLSCLIYTEKSSAATEDAPLRDALAPLKKILQDTARRIGQVSVDCKLDLDIEAYVEGFNTGMMELVYAWVNGARFVDICTMTKEFEGSIVRVIRRLEELTRQLGDAAKAIGDESLEAKFKDASAKMRRDVIFAASLYL